MTKGNKTRKYKLLKDLPFAEKGTVCEKSISIIDSYGYYMSIPTSDYPEDFVHLYESVINDFDAWFEPIEEDDGRWKPERGEMYWFVKDFGGLTCIVWIGDEVDKELYEVGNVFESHSEVKQAAEKVKEALMEFHGSEEGDE